MQAMWDRLPAAKIDRGKMPPPYQKKAVQLPWNAGR
jgi:hypothetical protein